jgi:hypothetical protein
VNGTVCEPDELLFELQANNSSVEKWNANFQANLKLRTIAKKAIDA